MYKEKMSNVRHVKLELSRKSKKIYPVHIISTPLVNSVEFTGVIFLNYIVYILPATITMAVCYKINNDTYQLDIVDSDDPNPDNINLIAFDEEEAIMKYILNICNTRFRKNLMSHHYVFVRFRIGYPLDVKILRKMDIDDMSIIQMLEVGWIQYLGPKQKFRKSEQSERLGKTRKHGKLILETEEVAENISEPRKQSITLDLPLHTLLSSSDDNVSISIQYIKEFQDECCKNHADSMITVPLLYKRYTVWSNTSTRVALDQVIFDDAMLNMGYEQLTIAGNVYWKNIQLKN